MTGGSNFMNIRGANGFGFMLSVHGSYPQRVPVVFVVTHSSPFSSCRDHPAWLLDLQNSRWAVGVTPQIGRSGSPRLGVQVWVPQIFPKQLRLQTFPSIFEPLMCIFFLNTSNKFRDTRQVVKPTTAWCSCCPGGPASRLRGLWRSWGSSARCKASHTRWPRWRWGKGMMEKYRKCWQQGSVTWPGQDWVSLSHSESIVFLIRTPERVQPIQAEIVVETCSFFILFSCPTFPFWVCLKIGYHVPSTAESTAKNHHSPQQNGHELDTSHIVGYLYPIISNYIPVNFQV